jgi:hypothetical protein
MRVTGLKVEMRHRRGINDHYIYFGEPEVSWGGEWGCPQSPNKWCNDAVFESDCVYCDDPKYTKCAGNKQGNGADAEVCIALEYKMDEWSTMINFLDPTFDRNVPPEEDNVQWPSAYFYGNCETCQAEDIGSIKARHSNAKKLRRIGIGTLLGGFVVYAGLALYFVVSKTIQKFHHYRISSRDGEEENHDEEDSSHNQQTDAPGPVVDEENQERKSSRESIEDQQNQNSVVDGPNQQTEEPHSRSLTLE